MRSGDRTSTVYSRSGMQIVSKRLSHNFLRALVLFGKLLETRPVLILRAAMVDLITTRIECYLSNDSRGTLP